MENSKTIISENSDHDYVLMKYSEGNVQINNIKYQVIKVFFCQHFLLDGRELTNKLDKLVR